MSQWERFLGLYKALGSVPLEGIERQGEGERKEGGGRGRTFMEARRWGGPAAQMKMDPRRTWVEERGSH